MRCDHKLDHKLEATTRGEFVSWKRSGGCVVQCAVAVE